MINCVLFSPLLSPWGPYALMRWLKNLFSTCADTSRLKGGKDDNWITIQEDKIEEVPEPEDDDGCADDERTDCPSPVVCSPVSSIYVCGNEGSDVILCKRPKKDLPQVKAEAPPQIKTVRQLVANFERSLSPVSPRSLPTSINPLSTPSSSSTSPSNASFSSDKVATVNSIDVEKELRRYQAMKKMAKFDERALGLSLRDKPLGRDTRHRSPTYPPNLILGRPYRSLQ